MKRTEFSPAKLNLFLAITGRRADGFHELVSVVARLDWGDTLAIETADEGFSLACDDPAVPVDGSNLVLKAAEAFRAATGWSGGARFVLEKRIPIGAGLGGGSSNAAAALRGLNALAGGVLNAERLAEAAAGVGSDCALFLRDGPVVMRGRGERVETLAAGSGDSVLQRRTVERLRGRRVLVFKPAFGISTAWAYGRMAAMAPGSYLSPADAEARLAAWVGDGRATVEELLFNNMEPVAFAKFPALPVLLERLRAEFGLAARMSGSGSACFALLKEDAPVDAITARIRDAWGKSAFVAEARLR
jgi:4-diphosphocytidyl-2-C-methyl-D-erythritol kinase